MPRQNATGVPMSSSSVKTPKSTHISMASILYGNEMRLVVPDQGHFFSCQQEADELFECKERDEDTAYYERHVIHALWDRQSRHGCRPGPRREIRAIPGHCHAESDHQHLSDDQHELACAVRRVVERDLKTQMITLTHPDGRTEKNEPAHEEQAGRFGPTWRLVEHVTAEDLPGDKESHQDEAGPRDPQGRLVDDTQDPGQRGKTVTHETRSP